MNERTVLVRLRAEVADYKRRMSEATSATREVGEAAQRVGVQATTAGGRLVQSANTQRQAWEQTGRGMVMFGTLTVGALAATAMAAIKWETAWTGVLKTVNGTDAELGVLEGGLRELARTLPSTHDEIAGVAEAAGQLGVRTKDVVGFTKVMIDLGQTTNLSAGEAATSIAQLMNVMRTAPEDVGRLGSALVALGNNGASTERDIILMAQRIAGAAAVVGLTEAEVLGLANALASVGIEVEAGGSAVSRVLMDMSKAVSQNSDELQIWARVAGMSGDEFAQRWKAAPAEALTAFISGLGNMQAAGQDVFTVLDQLGQSDIRTSRALLSMAVSGDLLTESLRMGTQAWEDNTALAEEAGKRYDTTAAKVAIAKNNLNDAAIDIGNNILPALASLAEGAADVARWFGGLPDPIKGGMTAIGGVAGVSALAAGGFLLLFPRVIDTVKAFRTLKTISPGLAGSLGTVSKAAGALAVTFVVASEAVELFGLKGDTRSMEQYTAELLKMDNAARVVGGDVPDILEKLNTSFDRISGASWWDTANDWADGFLGMRSNLGLAKDDLEKYGQALEGIYTSDPERAQRLFQQALQETGGTAKELLDLMPAYADALALTDNESQIAQESTTGLTETYNTLTGATELLTEEQAAYRQELADLDAQFVDTLGAYDLLIEKNQAAAQAAADATETTEDSWADFIDQFPATVDGYLGELQTMVDAQFAWETNMLLLSGRVSQGTLAELARMGPEGAPLVASLVDASDEQLARMETLFVERGTSATGLFAETLVTAAPIIAAAAAQLGDGAAAEIAAKLAAGTSTVAQIMVDYQLEIEGIVPTLHLNTEAAAIDLQNFVTASSGMRIYVDVAGREVGFRTPDGREGRAGGGPGPVWGPGTETSDSVDYRLSFNEHVWSAAEVKGAGGHASVASLRAAARSGALHPTQTMRFADGGSPAWSGRTTATPAGRGDVSVEFTGQIITADPTEAARAFSNELSWRLEGLAS